MSVLVVYYSGKGSNKYLANQIAKRLDSEVIELKPRASGLVIFATLTGLSLGNKKLDKNVTDYDSIVLCGPLFMGKFAAPCIDFLKSTAGKLKSLYVASCCCSSDLKKDDKFGYGKVFSELKETFNKEIKSCEAFPIELVLPDELKNDDKANMSTRLNDDNFKGKIKERLDLFVEQLT